MTTEREQYLEGLVAIQADAMNAILVARGYVNMYGNNPDAREDCAASWESAEKQIMSAISATAETVAAHRDKLTEALRREVALLRTVASKSADRLCAMVLCQGSIEATIRTSVITDLRSTVTTTQATAQAYEQEVEARGAVKALEEFLKRSGFESTAASTMLDELRATSKKAG